MVGDWVKIAYIKEDGTPVSKTFQVSEMQGKYAWSAKGGNMGDKLYPIELTPEILEKNIKVYYLCSYCLSTEESAINGYVLKVGVNCIIGINYVHELQHALRLCGLQELANNFKI